ncbi:MAG: GT-D fold domain-containing glycosyltransferase [Eggerthellaceae bacterium]
MAKETLPHKVVRVAGNIKRNVLFLMANDLSDRFYRTKDEAIEDVVYELEENQELFPHLRLVGREDTLRLLGSDPKSLIRFGDYDIDTMEGRDTEYQEFDPVLADRLKNILNEQHENCYVAINQSYFQSPFRFPERQHRFYRERGSRLRKCFLRECNPNSEYLDSTCFGAYYRFGDEYDFEGYYETVRGFFKDKDIVLVSGAGVFEKLEFDVFDLAKSKVIVHGPNKNAFKEYDDILERVTKIADRESSFICAILGQTAKVLVADLADRGYLAWDIGHLAKDYDVYKRGLAKTKENMDAFWGAD